MDWTRRGFLGSLSSVAAATTLSAQQRSGRRAAIKITYLRCAIIGKNPVVRIVTDQGISGYGEAESTKPYLKPMVLFYKDYLLGEDPTDVNGVMLKIRRIGAFRPWGKDDAEHSAGGADAERERQDGRHNESEVLTQVAKRE